LRVQELCDLKVEDVSENMQVIGKGNSRRLVCFRPEHVKVVELYLFLRRKI
jgi:site-specific recombinase XerD